MRPGQSSPGKLPRSAKKPYSRRRFNEAGAIKPRKTWMGGRLRAWSTLCFNEAGAIKPRKTLKAA